MLFNAVLGLHVAAGSVALLSGPVPMVAGKGGLLHRRAGDVFVVGMMLTAFSALTLSLMTGNRLLLVIAMFTFFMVWSGVRAIAFQRGGSPVLGDQGLCLLTLLFSAWLLVIGVLSADATSVFFGVGGAVFVGWQWRMIRQRTAPWLVAHLSCMGGAYIATVTAFLVVNLTFLPLAVTFIVPTIIGSPLIGWAVARQMRAFIVNRRAVALQAGT